MVLIGWFFSYLLGNAAENFYVFSAVLVLFSGLYIWLEKTIHHYGGRNKQLFRISFFVGLLFGFFHAHFVQSQFLVEQPATQTKLLVRVHSVSAASFVGEILDKAEVASTKKMAKDEQAITKASEKKFVPKIKLRFLKRPQQVELFAGAQVEASLSSCRKLDNSKSLFNRLESFGHIHYHCYLKDLQLLSEPAPWRIKVQKIIQKKLAKLPADSLAAGFLLGETSHIPFHSLSMFRKMGVAHIFSASGLHVGILSGIIVLPFSLLKLTPLGLWAALVFSFFYLMLLDFKVSLFRAFLFLLFFILLKIFDKKTSGLYLVLASTFVIELFAPLSLFTVSYILSAGITLTIIYLFPVYRSILQRFVIEKNPKQKFLLQFRKKSKNFFIDQTSLTLAAFTGSLFFSYIIFDYVNALSLLYNFVMVPLTGIYLFFVLLLFVWSPAKYFIEAGDWFFYALTKVHHHLFNKYFPVLMDSFMLYYLVFSFLLLIVLLYFFFSGKAWSIRKYGLLVFLAFFFSFFLQFPLQKNDQSKYYSFPYGVLHYQKGHLQVYGKPADFIKEKFDIAKTLNNLAIWKAEAEFPQELQTKRSFLGKINELESSSSSAALLRLMDERERMTCVVFQSISRKNYWQPKEIAECQEIHWVVGKKFRFNQKRAEKFFSRFGFQGAVKKSSYFKWQDL